MSETSKTIKASVSVVKKTEHVKAAVVKNVDVAKAVEPKEAPVKKAAVKAAVVAAKASKTASFDNSPSARLRVQSVRINRDGSLPEGFKYVARKTMRLNGRTIKPGIDVPEASTWPRVESWVRSGYLDIKET